MSLLLQHPVLTIRLHAGLNAASVLAGLAGIMRSPFFSLSELAYEKFPHLLPSVVLKDTCVNDIAGVTVHIDCQKSQQGHVHRGLADIAQILDQSSLSDVARSRANAIWNVIAQAEASVHNCSIDSVHFHEVGRLSNIVAIGLIAELFTALNPENFSVSAVPLADGHIHCAHGAVPNPAPALFAMLREIPVCPFIGQGEAVTPTGLAILKGLGANFGPWPMMTIEKTVTAFMPNKVFENAPNGLLFALGEKLS